MELLFHMHIAPLLPPDTLRALRCVSRTWQALVDQLLVKGAFGLRPPRKRTSGTPEPTLMSTMTLLC
jgi:hypothetical protein